MKQVEKRDYLAKGMAFNDLVRIAVVDLTDAVDVMQQHHGSLPTASAAIGRLMVAAAVMTDIIKDEQRLTLTVKGGGKLGAIHAQADAYGNVRAYADHMHIDFPLTEKGKLAVGEAVGSSGTLSVEFDYNLDSPYSGTVELVSGEIAEDIAYYFAASQQIPTVFAAGVLIGEADRVYAAGGYLIQLMPGAGEDIIDKIEKRMQEVLPMTELLRQGRTPEEIMEYLLGDEGLRILDEKKEYRFFCNCSREALRAALLSLSPEDLGELVPDEETEICCSYCSTCYVFSRSEIMDLHQ